MRYSVGNNFKSWTLVKKKKLTKTINIEVILSANNT